MMDKETLEILQRIRQKTNEADDNILISCTDFKYVVSHFSDVVELLDKENQRLRKALDQIETHIRSTSNPIPHIVKTLKEVEVEPE